MNTPVLHSASALLAVLSSFCSPLAFAHQPSSPTDSTHFQPFDSEQWGRERSLRPAAKRLQDLNVGEPRTVRLFYFLPNDRPYRAEVVEAMKTGVVELQTFFAEQMEAHDHGRKTFQIETDDQGNPVVHRVDGDYADSHYSSRGHTEGEIARAFDNSANAALIVMDVSRSSIAGQGTGSKSSGWLIIYGGWNWPAAAHELGHIFGLHHDFGDDKYILSYGHPNRSSAKLSACAAEFLTVHPYFNSDVPLENESPPTVELVSSSEFPFGAESVPVRLRVRDDDGLHQVILFVRPKNPFLGGTPEVKACQGLSGETDTVVEFNFDGRLPSDHVGTSAEAHTTLSNTVQHSIYVVVVDADGNRTSTFSPIQFTLEAGHSPQHIATLGYPGAGSVAFSPDGTIIALGRGGIVTLHDASTREGITHFRHTEGNRLGNEVAFSPDGTLLASGSGNGTIKVWNVASRENIATLEGHRNEMPSVEDFDTSHRIGSLDFSTDGTLLASGSRDGTVKLWNVATWTNSATIEHTDGIALVAFLPDGTLAFADFGDTVTLWDVTTESQISTLETHAISSGVAISPDGTILASGSLYSIKLWDLTTGTWTGSLNHMRDYPWVTLAFSPDGTILAVSANGLIEIWDVPTSELKATISGGPGGVGELLFSPDGTQLVSTGLVKFWDVSEWTTSQTTVCDRTPKVRDEIVEQSPVGACGDVTEGHLAAITSLPLENKSITALKVGDFDGLTALTELWLNGNQLSSLPAGIFDHLNALTTLSLHGNQLSSLPAGIFDHLNALTTLWLYSNQLSSLPADIFDHLNALTWLSLGGNQLSSLPAGIFDHLNALTWLFLWSNQLSSLPSGIFDNLNALTGLWLQGNPVNPLPLNVSLEKVGEGQFKAVAPTGAPFDIVLPLNVANGSINDGATTITIPTGSVESSTLTVTRTPGTTFAVTVNIGNLPSLPTGTGDYGRLSSTDTGRNEYRLHQGYALVKSGNLPIELIESFPVSYDTDGDGLIEVGNLAQLNAIRWDLDGDGAVDNAANESSYAAAFPIAAAGMGCPTTCIGYELAVSLSFDENGDRRITPADAGYWNGGAGWVPIGGFSATLEGNFHHISRLYIDRASERNVGLFSQVSDSAKIRNVGLNEIIVTGGRNSGGLVGQNSGTIIASYATGSVTGGRNSGGLVGSNWRGTIIASYATGSVTTSGPSGGAGGLVGQNWGGTIIASYATGSVKSSGSSAGAGGLVGDNWTSTSIIIASYATGSVNSSGLSARPGGLVGKNSGTIIASYWDTTTSGLSTSSGGTGKSTAQLKSPTGYTGIYVNWDVDLDNADGDDDLVTGPDDPWDFGTAGQYPALNVESLRALAEITPYGEIIPSTLVCDRTPQVRDAILGEISNISDCALVTEAHLAAITRLSLSGDNITTLKVGDFDGLTGLESLLVTNSSLSSLPAGIFDNLTALTLLNLERNELSSLPADIFDKLTALTTLDLGETQLSLLPAGIFDKLTALTKLELGANQLSTLPVGIFNKLSDLTFLNLYNNQLSSLPVGIFDRLTALTNLYLSDNPGSPFSLTVSLEKVADGQFKAVAPTGAPFDIVLPLTVANGNITGGATTGTIPKGSVESTPLTVTRTPGTTSAVTVDIGTLPGLPNDHSGYSLVKSTDLPLEVISGTTGEQTSTDFNGDGKTDFVDFFLFADAYGGTDARFDLDGSGTVDFVDFFQFVDAFDQPGQAKLLALAREMLGLPAGPQLQQNAPNPFNSETVISWFLLEPGTARLEVFALTGQRLAVLHRGPLPAGRHRIHWDGRDHEGRPLASGVYLYRLMSPGGVLTRKLTLLR